jgi:hypothetical protein
MQEGRGQVELSHDSRVAIAEARGLGKPLKQLHQEFNRMVAGLPPVELLQGVGDRLGLGRQRVSHKVADLLGVSCRPRRSNERSDVWSCRTAWILE